MYNACYTYITYIERNRQAHTHIFICKYIESNLSWFIEDLSNEFKYSISSLERL